MGEDNGQAVVPPSLMLRRTESNGGQAIVKQLSSSCQVIVR